MQVMIIAYDVVTGKPVALATCGDADRWSYTPLEEVAAGNILVQGSALHPVVTVNPGLKERFRFESYTDLNPQKSKAKKGLVEIDTDE